MNNKLFARIAAAAVGVSMLSTFVFADEAANASLSSDKSQLTLNATAIADATGEGATQVTMMAYLVGADATIATAYVDEATTPMVALEQVSTDEVPAKLATINVLASKFTDAFPNAVIKTGHNGTVGAETGGVTWFISTVSTPEGKKITIMNGATAIDIDVVDGVATLPTDTKFDKTSTEYTFELYSWVALDAEGNQKAEYIISEGTTVNAADLEGLTLYAKFATTCPRGDFDGDGTVGTSDLSAMKYAVLGKFPNRQKNIGQPIYEGATILKGVLTADAASAGTADLSAIKYAALGKMPNRQKDATLPWYVVNK